MSKSLGEVVEVGNTIEVGEEKVRPKSTRAALEAAYEQLEVEADEGTPEADDSGTELRKEAKQRAERERGDDGKFVSKSKDKSEAHESGEVETIEAPKEPAIESAPTSAPVFAPPSWAADARETFNQLPPRVQQEIVRRETDLRRGLQQATDRTAQVERTWGEVDALLKPYEGQLARAGATKAQVLKQSLEWQKYLDTDLPAAMTALARSYGTDLRTLAQLESQQPQEPAYVGQIRQQLQQTQALIQQNQQREAENRRASVLAELSAFASETDSAGNPVRPFIEHVEADMVPIVQSLMGSGMPVRQILQQAYEKAIWLNPSTREMEIKKVASQASSTQNVARAKKAARLVNGDARGDMPADRPKSTRAALEANWEKLNP